MDEAVYPAEAVYEEQSGSAREPPAVLEELKREARERGLWNLFLPDDRYGAGLTKWSTRRWPRAIGLGERGLDLMIARAASREVFGLPLAAQGVVQNWIAESRLELDQARLLILKTAWLIATVGAREARTEIAGIKVAAARAAGNVLDRAIQVHGAAGLSGDFPLARAGATPR
jgi:alkylation response protein AidB-like acyl-CoA dehydrogenase